MQTKGGGGEEEQRERGMKTSGEVTLKPAVFLQQQHQLEFENGEAATLALERGKELVNRHVAEQKSSNNAIGPVGALRQHA